MGGTASVLPERLTELQVKNVAGNQFDKTQFDSLKDEDGKIAKENLLTILLKHEEKTRDKFMAYCNPETEMNSITFIAMCKDADIIDLQLRAIDAQEMFESARSKQNAFAKNITFEIFMRYIISDIANKKFMTQVDVMSHFYNSPGPSPLSNLAESLPGSESAVRPRASIQGSPDAAARRRSLGPGPGTYIDFNAPGESEGQVQYILFCPDGEMVIESCLKLCKDVGLLDDKFTKENAEIVYKQAKNYVSQKQGFPTNSIKYTVFRHVCIPAIATIKGIKELDVLIMIGRGQGPMDDAIVTEPVQNESADQNKLAVSTEVEVIAANVVVGLTETIKDGMSLLEDANDREVKEKFLMFCPDGRMDSASFAKFCNDLGLINEIFKIEHAEISFQKGRDYIAQKQESPSQVIRYNVFRRICLPDVATKKLITEVELVNLINNKTEPHSNDKVAAEPNAAPVKASTRKKSVSAAGRAVSRSSSVKRGSLSGLTANAAANVAAVVASSSDIKPAAARRRTVADNAGPGASSLDSVLAATEAARRLSAIGKMPDASLATTRRKTLTTAEASASSDSILAATTTTFRRQSSNASEDTVGTSQSKKAPPIDRRKSRRSITADVVKIEEPFFPTEYQLKCVKAAFLKFATDPEGEMTAPQFIKLMREGQLLTKAYNTVEAEILYMEAKQKAQKPGALYPLTAASHMSFDVFYNICVPVIAKKRDESVEALITILSVIEDAYKVLMIS